MGGAVGGGGDNNDDDQNENKIVWVYGHVAAVAAASLDEGSDKVRFCDDGTDGRKADILHNLVGLGVLHDTNRTMLTPSAHPLPPLSEAPTLVSRETGDDVLSNPLRIPDLVNLATKLRPCCLPVARQSASLDGRCGLILSGLLLPSVCEAGNFPQRIAWTMFHGLHRGVCHFSWPLG